MRIVINDFPMPPTLNKLFYSVEKKRKKDGSVYRKWKKDKVYKDYISLCHEWAFRHYLKVKDIKKQIAESSNLIRLDTYFIFPYLKIFSRSGAVRKMDASNRLKALHDTFSTLISVDDSFFFSGYFGKFPTSDSDERVIMIIGEMKEAELRQFLDPSSYLTLES